MQTIDFHIPELDGMKHYPEILYFRGNTDLLKRRKISIVGSRKPNQYTQQMTQRLASDVISNKKRDYPMKNEIRGMLYGQSL